jgi:Zn-dependent peptidase ImmA (M78 family)
VWVPSERVILIDCRLNRSERRATLAHELSHVDLGHRAVGGWFGRRLERDADSLAACRLLSSVGDLAEALVGQPELAEAADMLDVPLSVLRLRIDLLTDAERSLIDERVSSALSM